MKNDRNKRSDKRSEKPNPQSRNAKGKKDIRDPKLDKAHFSGYEEAAGHTNDVAWYALDAQMLSDAANVSFGNPAGALLPTPNGKPYEYEYTNQAVPGILKVNYVPTLGNVGSYSDPVNLAASALYTFTRRSNAGSANYEPADLMMTMLAVGSAHEYLAWCKRLYGVANAFTHTNRYIGDALIHAMGADVQDVRMHMADFRAWINQFARNLGQLWVPANFPYFQRRNYLVSNYFIDSTNTKGQMYFYNPVDWYLYDGYTSEDGGRLVLSSDLYPESDWNGGQYNWKSRVEEHDLTFYAITTFGDEMLRRLLNDNDIAIQGGDMLKAFGENAQMIAAPIVDDLIAFPVYDETAILQLNNLMVAGSWGANSMTVGQSGGLISCSPIYTRRFDFINTTVNRRSMGDNPAEVMEATRFQYTVLPDSEGGYTRTVATIGAEWIESLQVYYNATTSGSMINGAQIVDTIVDTDYLINEGNETEWLAFSRALCLLSNFDWHPYVRLWREIGDGDTRIQLVHGDFDNYTTVFYDTLAKINACAWISLFRSPLQG
nr:putative capsid protein [Picobirnavirus sp.]